MAKNVGAFFKKNWHFALLALIILFNVIWIIQRTAIHRNRNDNFQLPLFVRQQLDNGLGFQKARSDLYGMSCPEISGISLRGERIDLRNFFGSVIILRFSRFFRQDLPDVVYLQELYEQQKVAGVHLIFINSRGKHDQDEINKIVHLSAPIIEDEGIIRAAFNAYPEDTIIIDRDFKVRFQSEKTTKSSIYDEVKKWTLGNSPQQYQTSDEKLSQAVSDLAFYDINKSERTKITNLKGNLIITVFSGICTGCQENSRIQLLKELSQRDLSKKVKVLLIFGMGNTLESLREYSYLQGWDKLPITVGIVEESSTSNRDSYYQVFSLDVDPKTYVLNSEGKILFMESRKKSKAISLEMLMQLL